MNPIVGIGEVLWDVYPDGRKVAGGAPFNFAFHCHQLGHPSAIVSRVGDDALGRELRERVRELGLSEEYIQTDRDHPTGTVQVALDANKVPTYTITENVAWDHITWDGKLGELGRTTAVVCHGTLALRSKESGGTILKMSKRTRDRGQHKGLVVLDVNLRENSSKRAKPWVFEHHNTAVLGSNWIKMNEHESGFVRGCIDDISDDEPWPQTTGATFEYLKRFSKIEDRLFIVTRGADGAEITTATTRERVGGVPATVVDTVGAGDAFTAAMVCLHLEGKPLRECARFANHYAARVCEQPGGTPRIDRAEVERQAFGM